MLKCIIQIVISPRLSVQSQLVSTSPVENWHKDNAEADIEREIQRQGCLVYGANTSVFQTGLRAAYESIYHRWIVRNRIRIRSPSKQGLFCM